MARKRLVVIHAPWRTGAEEDKWAKEWRKSDTSIRAALHEPRTVTKAREKRKKLKKLPRHRW